MATGKYQYIIELRDRMSSHLSAITASVNKSKAATNVFTGSVGDLREEIEKLRSKRDLLPVGSLQSIRDVNKQIESLETKLHNIENAGSGGKLKGYFDELKSSVAGVALNPLALGAAATGFTLQSGMKFEEGMSKVNITAQLDPKGREQLADQISDIATKYHLDLAVAPDGFEKIISQTGDVERSLNILDAAVKATRAGFVDLDTVSAAAAQTVSITGADANDVLDTFFAAKRVGAGEFADFANYMPGLIASADTLGVKYKDVAGIFAYMTGKGQSAERASVLMGNMFSILQRTDVTDKLKASGISVFDDTGKMRDIVDIFTDLNGVMSSMSDEQASAFMQNIGIVDKEAKSAFAIMKSDLGKLSESMDEVRNSSGEMDEALELAKNPMQEFNDLIADIRNIATDFGINVMPIVSIAIETFGGILSVVGSVVSVVADFIGGWIQQIRDGNPLVIALTGLLVGLTIAMNAHAIISGIVGVATKVWAGAQAVLNAVLYASPIVWIVAGIIALIAVIVFLCTKVEGWGKQWESIMNFLKLSGQMIVQFYKAYFNTIANAFMIVIDKLRLGWYQFKEAIGIGDSTENQKMISQMSASVEARKQSIIDEYKKVGDLAKEAGQALTWELKWKDGKSMGETISDYQEKLLGKPKPKEEREQTSTPESKNTPKGSTLPASGVVNLDKLDLKGSASYAAIASKLAPVTLSSSESASLPTTTSATAAEASAAGGGNSLMKRGKAVVQKICDTIEIHIASADGKGYDRIREEVSKVFLEVVADYA